MDPNQFIRPPPPKPLSGAEVFTGVDASVLDFWRYAMSDLRMNNVRGYLAEFLVAKAVGATAPREEWAAFDVLSHSGNRIEVKTRGHLQSWAQAKPSLGSFQVKAAQGWDHRTGTYSARGWHADVYAFCVHTARDHDQYDVLDIAQWVSTSFTATRLRLGTARA